MTSAPFVTPYDGRMGDRARTSAGGRPWVGGAVGALVVDAVLVVIFAITGRAHHAEHLDAAGVWATAWPFLVSLLIAWIAARAWRHPLALWPTGVLIWVVTLVVGMLLRLASGEGAALAFVIVAAITLALLLVGWRGIAAAIGRTRRRGRAAAADPRPGARAA